MESSQVLALIVLSASVIEAGVEFVGDPLVSLIVPGMPKELRKKAFAILSSAIGVTVAILLNISVYDLIPGFSTDYAVVGQVLTGVLLGRGSDWFHAFLTKIKGGGS